MRLLVELEVQDEKVPIWSHSEGIVGYSNRTLKECKNYVKYFLEYLSGIEIKKITKK